MTNFMGTGGYKSQAHIFSALKGWSSSVVLTSHSPRVGLRGDRRVSGQG